jgi:hypothetical protein
MKKSAKMSSNTTSSKDITEILTKEYMLYLATQDRGDMTAVEGFMSPSCWQLARQDPSWNLESRSDIMKILNSTRDPKAAPQERGKVDIRAPTKEERNTLPDSEKERASLEGWEALRVDLEDADPAGRLVKVIYYFRKEHGRWVHCLHDLIFVGPRSGGTGDATKGMGAEIFGKK